MKGFGEDKKKKKDELKEKRRQLYIKTRIEEDVPFLGSDIEDEKE